MEGQRGSEAIEEVTKKRSRNSKNGRGNPQVTITLYGPIAKTVLQQCEISRSHPQQWLTELVEVFRCNHRSGKYAGDPTRHSDREESNDVVYHEW